MAPPSQVLEPPAIPGRFIRCERIFKEKASGGTWDLPELHRLLDHIRKGDVLVVWHSNHNSCQKRVTFE